MLVIGLFGSASGISPKSSIIEKELVLYKEVFVKSTNCDCHYDFDTRRSDHTEVIFVDTVDLKNMEATYSNSYSTYLYSSTCIELALKIDTIESNHLVVQTRIRMLEPSGDTIRTDYYTCGYQLCFVPYKLKFKCIAPCHPSYIYVSTRKKRSKCLLMNQAKTNMYVITEVSK